MVKILVIGDFHGKFPSRLLKRIKKENFDLVVSPGDFCGNKELGRLFFEYAYGKDEELWEFIGKKKFNELERKNFNSGVKILKILNRLGKPVICVTGNWDPNEYAEIGFSKPLDKFAKPFFSNFNRLKNIFLADYKQICLDKTNFFGYPRSTYPGFINKKRERELIEENGKKVIKRIKKTKEDNKKYFFLFKRLFDENDKNTIFISHNCPYNSKLDKIKKGPQKGKHYGSWLTRKIILDLKPGLVICGHMHENRGIQKIGKTVVVNAGAAFDGRAAVIDYPVDGKGKIKVRFIR
jgi:Icc-related predicted phosphoesterase